MSSYTLLLLCLVFSVGYITADLPEMDLTSVELVNYWGYTVETHHVTTEDGYVLAMHRIPRGKNNSTEMPTADKPKPVFFLQHAFVCSSSSFLMNLPHQSLGFILADAGYDVWMGNARGNTYSRKHDTLDPESKKFWDFTYQEMATYDLPAMIDYTLNSTNQKQVYYVGHSQGTLMAFVGLSENKELQTKIKLFFAMAAVSRIAHVNNLIHIIANFRRPLKFISNLFGHYEILASNEETKSFGKFICPMIPNVCNTLLFILNGIDTKNLNSTRTPLYLANIPAGSSEKNLDHYLQMVNTHEFKKYDHGADENKKRYGTERPPIIDIGTIQTPVVLIHGSNDTIVQPIDVAWTEKHLPNVLSKITVEGYNHIDFIIAMNAQEHVYKHIIDIARRFM